MTFSNLEFNIWKSELSTTISLAQETD